MSTQTEQLLGQLHKLVAEIESVARAAGGVAEDGGAEVASKLGGALAGARDRLQDVERKLERDLVQHGKVLDGYVRENVWVSIGVVAAVAFLLGAMTRRHD